jgi:hypothetical protein
MEIYAKFFCCFSSGALDIEYPVTCFSARHYTFLSTWDAMKRREEKNSQSLLVLEPLIFQAIAQCYTTKLSWLLYMIMCF